jgi:hypothetical protein
MSIKYMDIDGIMMVYNSILMYFDDGTTSNNWIPMSVISCPACQYLVLPRRGEIGGPTLGRFFVVGNTFLRDRIEVNQQQDPNKI